MLGRVNTSACIKGSSSKGSGKHHLCSALLILASTLSVLHGAPGRLEAVSGCVSGAVLAGPGLDAAMPQLPCSNASEGLRGGFLFPSLLRTCSLLV